MKINPPKYFTKIFGQNELNIKQMIPEQFNFYFVGPRRHFVNIVMLILLPLFVLFLVLRMSKERLDQKQAQGQNVLQVFLEEKNMFLRFMVKLAF